MMKTISRKEFIKSLGFAGITALAVPVLIHCKNDEEDDIVNPEISTECAVTNSETEGPYPTKNPSTLLQTNIVGDRTGIALEVNITVQNTSQNCAALQGAYVDVWHCDAEGNYSEYSSYTSAHFLRGRQMSDAEGKVQFTSIFPGWYNGRATHIHVHIYNASGTSLLVTQIAFPEGTSSAVNMVNASSAYRGMSGYTYNSQDNVFGDGYANELSSITGSNENGYVLSHIIKVRA